MIMSNDGNRNRNKIIDIVVLVMFVAVIIYCISYARNFSKDSAEDTGYHVSIRGHEDDAAEQTVQKADPYQNDYLPIGVLTQCGDWTKEVSLYVSDGVCYAFLPAYTEKTELAYIFDSTLYEVVLSGRVLASGEKLQDVEINAEYDFVITDKEENDLHYTMVFLQSRNLPSVFIDTQSGSMDYVDSYKGNEESGQFSCVTAEGEIDSSAAMSRIKGRGNTSWEGIGGKNPYSVQFASYTDILHMGAAQNWILQGNKLDASMMRNKLAYDFAGDIGIPYAVDSEFTDLYLNGRYMGTYLICEKVEVAHNRIDIGSGYLLEENFRATDESVSFSTNRGTYIVNNPEFLSEEAFEYIADYVTAAFDSVKDAEKDDEWQNYIDLDSFAKLYVMDEIGNDPDNNALSTFYYKEDSTDNTKLTAGPVWDFDIALGNDERDSDALLSYFGEEWFEHLYKSKVFRDEVAELLQSIMENYYDKYANHYFEDMEEYLRASYSMNGIKWKEEQGYIASYYSGLEENMSYLDNYFMTRLENLNAVYNGPGKMHKVEFAYRGRTYAHTYVPDGEVIPEQVLGSLMMIDGALGWKLPSEQAIDPYAYAVYGDIGLERLRQPVEVQTLPNLTEEESGLTYTEQNNDRGELAMQWISFIMLMVPGLISVWISGNTKIKKENAFAVLTQYLLNSFVVILVAYGIFYVLYGSVLFSFSDVYNTAYDYSIYNVNVTFKYMALAGVLSVAVGIVERIVFALMRKRKANGK